jgi:hypothetical protein
MGCGWKVGLGGLSDRTAVVVYLGKVLDILHMISNESSGNRISYRAGMWDVNFECR